MKKNEEVMSDEELLRFIENVEENDLIEAPFYLKDTIMTKAQNWQMKNVRRQYRAFQMKVCLATAAAVAVILLIPSELKLALPDREAEPITKEEYMEKHSRTFSNNVDDFVHKMIGQISFKEDKKV